jgi:sulfate/thiosulfate transport system permease protein
MADLALAPTTAPPIRTAPSRRGTPTTAASWVRRIVVVVFVGILVLLPVGLLVYRTFEPGLNEFFNALSDPATEHAFKVTAIVAGSALVINTVFGVGVAILLTRYRFPGRRLLNALIDLPVAVSPIVVGLALILVFGPTGWFGSLDRGLGIQVINAKPGMVLATVFVSMPLVVRAVAPVLVQAGMEQEHAAASLGANAFTRFRRITLPTIRIALAYGVVLSLARCIGEYGAVLVVSGNIQGQTETAPLRINNLYENFEVNQANAITFVLMLIAVIAILIGALIRHRQGAR